MKYFSGIILLITSCFSCFATSVTVTGDVQGLWTTDTVLVEGNLVIQPGELLVIAPGTLVQFQSYYRVDVLGRILAQGLPGDSIIFSIRDTSNFSAQSQGRGGWSGFRFRQLATTEDSSVFSYCRFEFSKATEDSANSYGGALFAHEFSKLRINNCMFFHNYSFYSGGAVYLNNSDARIEDCRFTSNYAGNTGTVYGYGGGICCMNGSAQISRNGFYYNSSTGVGGAASFDNSDPIFNNNIMQYNYSALGGAFGVLRSSPSRTISNNLIINNTALFFGGGICCIRSFPVFSNITIANNTSAYGGAFYCNDSAVPSMYNSIMWGNSGFGISVYIWDVSSAPNFYYCDIEGDTSDFEGSGAHLGYHGQYQNNINEDPLFYGNGLFPYQVLVNSPSIDTGTPDASFLDLPPVDLAGAARVENNHIDLGAYEYNGTTRIKTIGYNSNSLISYPNPFKETVLIKIPESYTSGAIIHISDIQGRLVRKLNSGNTSQTILWDGCDQYQNQVPDGIYLLKVTIGLNNYTGKLIKQDSRK